MAHNETYVKASPQDVWAVLLHSAQFTVLQAACQA